MVFIIIASDGLWDVFPNKEVVMEIKVLGLPMMTIDMGLSWSPSPGLWWSLEFWACPLVVDIGLEKQPNPSMLVEGLMLSMPTTLMAHVCIELAHWAAPILNKSLSL